MISFLDFEKPIAELEGKIHELRQLGEGEGDDGAVDIDIEEEVARLQAKADGLLKETYAKLTPWQKVQVARHPSRPQFQDYIDRLIDDFLPLAGDRSFGDDKAITGGIGRFRGREIFIAPLFASTPRRRRDGHASDRAAEGTERRLRRALRGVPPAEDRVRLL